MASERATGLTYENLVEMFPEDDLTIRELIGGELFVSPPATVRHQRTSRALFLALHEHAAAAGGEVLFAPTAVWLTERDFVEPDLLYLRPQSAGKVEAPFIRGGPDLVVEISSPSTRGRDRTLKRELYARHRVSEYWFVDLDADRVEVHRLEGDRYARPVVLQRGDTLDSPLLPGFEASVDEILPPE